MKPKIRILVLVLALFLLVTSMLLADGGLSLARWVLGGGASGSAADNVSLRATLGQPVVGVVSNGDVTLGQGFWHGGYLPESEYEISLPLLQR